MIYIGSGQFKDRISKNKSCTKIDDYFVFGKRLKNIRLSTIYKIFNSKVIYLDTTEFNIVLYLSNVKKLKFLFNPYRIEKYFTYIALKIICSRVIRLKIPSIINSKAWQKISVTEGGITVEGYTYEDYISLILHAANNNLNTYNSSDIYKYFRTHNIPIKKLNTLDCLSAQILIKLHKIHYVENEK